jgi:hypothetical protein
MELCRQLGCVDVAAGLVTAAFAAAVATSYAELWCCTIALYGFRTALYLHYTLLVAGKRRFKKCELGSHHKLHVDERRRVLAHHADNSVAGSLASSCIHYNAYSALMHGMYCCHVCSKCKTLAQQLCALPQL